MNFLLLFNVGLIQYLYDYSMILCLGLRMLCFSVISKFLSKSESQTFVLNPFKSRLQTQEKYFFKVATEKV